MECSTHASAMVKMQLNDAFIKLKLLDLNVFVAELNRTIIASLQSFTTVVGDVLHAFCDASIAFLIVSVDLHAMFRRNLSGRL